MLTIFSTPKPFIGHSKIIQRNALKSWALLHPDVEVILFGNEEGAAEVCRELAIRHEPDVRRNENGTKFLNYIFDRAREMSRHPFLCYANCDIMLPADLCDALERSSKVHSEFLIVGRRWDTDITEPWDFKQPDWNRKLKAFAVAEGKRNGPSWVDYFCFSRDLYYRKMPPFLIGRPGWDPWLTWFARHSKLPVIDASREVVAVHQNHDYAYMKQGVARKLGQAEARHNWDLCDTTEWHFYTTDAATEILTRKGLRPHRMAWLGPVKSRFTVCAYKVWFSCLALTRPIRDRLGLRRRALGHSP